MTKSSQSPLVSVIVPVYNTSATVKRCLNSIFAQTYQQLEIIIIDDGSTDDSLDLLQSLVQQDSRVQLIHQSNQGLSAARNAGIKAATGAFITFVDSDDTIEPGLIETLVHQSQKDHTDLVIASFARILPNQKRQAFYSPSNHDPVILDRITCLTRMLCEDGFTLSAWGKLYARRLFQAVDFPVGKLYEDVGTTHRLVLQCEHISFIPLVLYNYYQNPTSIIHQTFNKSKLSLLKLTDQMCDELTTQLIDPVLESSSPTSSRTIAETMRLSDAIRKRRVHARLSLLRQIVLTPHYRRNPRTCQLVQYIREHENDILHNPLSTKRDLLAIYTLRLGLPVFRLAWKTYEHLR